jgi:hypothetical protein
VADGVRITCPGDTDQLARLDAAIREVLPSVQEDTA